MKKRILWILASIIAFCPFVVYASHTGEIASSLSKCTLISQEGNVETRECDVYVNTTENEKIAKADFYFVHGPAIKKFECVEAEESEYLAEQSTSGEQILCSYTEPSGGADGEHILVGKFRVTIDRNNPDEDCTINFTYDGQGGKINPQTGATMPFIIIAAGVAAVGAIYFVTSKKSKLFKI